MITSANQKKFIIFIVCASIIVGFLLFFILRFMEMSFRNKFVDIESKKELIIAHDTAKLIEYRMKDLEEKLNLVVLTPEIQNPTPVACKKKLEEIVSLFHGKLNYLSRVDLNKRAVCSSLDAGQGLDLSTNSNVLETFKTKQLTLGRAIYSNPSKKYVISLIAPIYKNNVFDGTLNGTIFLDSIRDQYLSGFGSYNYAYLIILDDNGDILYHNIKDLIGKNRLSPEVRARKDVNVRTPELMEKAFQGHSGIIEYKADSGQNEFVTYAPVNVFPNRHWVVMSNIFADEIEKRVQANFKSGQYNIFVFGYIAITAIIGLAISIIIFYTLHRIFKLDK